MYLASYLQRFSEQVETRWSGLAKPDHGYKPDFGASVVLTVTFFLMPFVAGARLSIFAGLVVLMVGAMVMIAVLSPYRLARIIIRPPMATPIWFWLSADTVINRFGRGGWFGVGLGNSIQKIILFAEAHTDFLFAVIGEELVY